MTEVLLIRHGQSANNALPEDRRVSDPGLTDLGVQQAEATASWLSSANIDHLYCSPFLRSLETTRPIAAATGLRVSIRPDIFEQGGCYSGYKEGEKIGEAGMSRAELGSRYPGWRIDPTIGEHGWWGRDYELLEEATARARRVAGWIQAKLVPRGGSHALIIHADFKRLLIEAMLGSEATSVTDVIGPLHNVGVTTLVWQDKRWILVTLNSTGHVPRTWLT